MTKTLNPKDLSQPDLHNILLTAVAPRPICFASTVDQDGNVNLSPFSFFNVFSSNPPVMIFSPARSGRDNTTKHTLQNIMEVKETVINIVNYPIVEQMSLSSTAYAKGVNEFVKAGLTEVPSDKVRPPRVGEAPVAFECTVDQVIELGDQGGAGNLVIARVEMIHIQEEYLDEHGKLDTRKLDLVARMGGSLYCHANGDALFEIPKPLRTKGMGIDQLPDFIKTSKHFNGNELARLGNLEALPAIDDINAAKSLPEVQSILTRGLDHSDKKDQIMSLAKKLIDQKEAMKALIVLMTLGDV